MNWKATARPNRVTYGRMNSCGSKYIDVAAQPHASVSASSLVSSLGSLSLSLSLASASSPCSSTVFPFVECYCPPDASALLLLVLVLVLPPPPSSLSPPLPPPLACGILASLEMPGYFVSGVEGHCCQPMPTWVGDICEQVASYLEADGFDLGGASAADYFNSAQLMRYGEYKPKNKENMGADEIKCDRDFFFNSCH